MAFSVEVPSLGEDMAGGVVAEWYLPDGSTVEPGTPVCRIESSFVAVEVEAEGTGLLRHQKPAGSIERPGAVLGLILAPGESMPSEQPAAPAVSVRRAASVGTIEVIEEVPAEFDPERWESSVHPEPEPEPEFEEALAESVVVPFPRRFQPQEDFAWAEAPGDAVEFASSFFSGAPDEQTNSLTEPGTSIPGLPLWEPEDERAGKAAYIDPGYERFARIAAEAAASAQVLAMTITVDMAEATRMLAVCAREWRRFGATPLLEDLVFRALALALREGSNQAGPGGLLIASASSDTSCGLASPAEKTFREAVAARETGGDAPFESAAWVLTSLAAFGVAMATPRLDGGRQAAFAIGGTDAAGRETIAMSYDSAAWDEGSAARLLARARDVLEAPYAMLV